MHVIEIGGSDGTAAGLARCCALSTAVAIASTATAAARMGFMPVETIMPAGETQGTEEPEEWVYTEQRRSEERTEKNLIKRCSVAPFLRLGPFPPQSPLATGARLPNTPR